MQSKEALGGILDRILEQIGPQGQTGQEEG
jgi:hypothetical protein